MVKKWEGIGFMVVSTLQVIQTGQILVIKNGLHSQTRARIVHSPCFFVVDFLAHRSPCQGEKRRRKGMEKKECIATGQLVDFCSHALPQLRPSRSHIVALLPAGQKIEKYGSSENLHAS